MKDKKLQPVF